MNRTAASNENAPGAAGTATEGSRTLPYQKDDSMNEPTAITSPKQPEGFVCEVAAFPSDDGTMATIGAQLHIDDGTVHRLLVLNGHYGIDVEHVPALIDALCTARAMVGDAADMLGVAV